LTFFAKFGIVSFMITSPLNYKIPFALDGKRLDIAARKIIEAELGPVKREFIQAAFAAGTLLYAGAPAEASHRVERSKKLTLTPDFLNSLHADQTERTVPEGPEPTVISEHEDFIVLNKPSGWLTHPVANSTREVTLLDWARTHFATEELFLVHRLDRNTSGVILLAKSTDTEEALRDLFQARDIHKTYVALVEGNLAEESGIVNAPLRRKKGSFKRISGTTKWKEGDGALREAETAYRVIGRFPGHDILLLEPKTGRTHQIRSHIKYLGHPIVGDVLYGSKAASLGRQFLHAKNIAFLYSGKKYSFAAPLPETLALHLKTLDGVSFLRYDDEALQSLAVAL
jgi:23S rRNA pseudouridine1911/1915/1917 synthase